MRPRHRAAEYKDTTGNAPGTRDRFNEAAA